VHRRMVSSTSGVYPLDRSISLLSVATKNVLDTAKVIPSSQRTNPLLLLRITFSYLGAGGSHL
jgi:hypothetical protein